MTGLSRTWWRSGYLWLMIGLTLAAFAGGGVTLYLAMQAPVEPPAQTSGVATVPGQEGALEPALQARNRTSSRNGRAMGGGER